MITRHSYEQCNRMFKAKSVTTNVIGKGIGMGKLKDNDIFNIRKERPSLSS